MHGGGGQTKIEKKKKYGENVGGDNHIRKKSCRTELCQYKNYYCQSPSVIIINLVLFMIETSLEVITQISL